MASDRAQRHRTWPRSSRLAQGRVTNWRRGSPPRRVSAVPRVGATDLRRLRPDRADHGARGLRRASCSRGVALGGHNGAVTGCRPDGSKAHSAASTTRGTYSEWTSTRSRLVYADRTARHRRGLFLRRSRHLGPRSRDSVRVAHGAERDARSRATGYWAASVRGAAALVALTLARVVLLTPPGVLRRAAGETSRRRLQVPLDAEGPSDLLELREAAAVGLGLVERPAPGAL